MNNEPLKLDTLVELQDQYSNVYPLSPTGARGWVRARRELPKTDPEVFIEWARDHWRYHGERDGWTFEHHFRPVEADIPDAPNPEMPDLHQILAEAHRRVDAERCPECGDFHSDDEEFIDTLAEAHGVAAESDGYFMMTLTSRHSDDAVMYEPQIYSHVLTPVARRVLEAQLMSIASQIFQSQMLDEINAMGHQDDESGR